MGFYNNAKKSECSNAGEVKKPKLRNFVHIEQLESPSYFIKNLMKAEVQSGTLKIKKSSRRMPTKVSIGMN